DPADLEDAMRKIAAGERVVAPDALSVLIGLVGAGEDRWEVTIPEAGDNLLTPKELEVLGHLTKGLTNREIAASLVVSEATVKSHLARIYEKLGAPGRREAVRRGIELGILS
ncbi:MAG TPA: response regulator transcription factor, partial [Acidimicrobiia bacterium]|nr:response regulator transcription factor [Acidimicrobiia bacterium]